MSHVYLSSISQATSLGDSLTTFWHKLINGQSGVRPIHEIDDIDFRAVPIHFCHTLQTERLDLPPREENQIYLENRILLDQLLEDLQISGPIDGIIWGNGQVGMPPHESAAASISANEWQNSVQASLKKATGQTVPPSRVVGLSLTCNTGIAALGMAAQRIAAGHWERAIVVVQEVRCRDRILLPYYKLNLLSRGRTHPFAEDRDGFEKGEGGCAFLLESSKAAEESKADPFCRISGYSVQSEHEHVFESSRSSAVSATSAITNAAQRAGIEISDIDYVNLYGSGSVKNDKMECTLIKSTFGERYRSVPANSLKPYFGHLNHAASAIETAAVALMLKEQRIVNNLALSLPDAECDLFLPTNWANNTRIRHALKISFGFGWSNAALIMSQT